MSRKVQVTEGSFGTFLHVPVGKWGLSQKSLHSTWQQWLVKGRKLFLNPLRVPWLGPQIKHTKSSRRNQQMYLHVVEAFVWKWRPKEIINLECFYSRFEEEWKVVGKFDRTKGYKLRIQTEGNSNTRSFRFFSDTLQREDPFLWA